MDEVVVDRLNLIVPGGHVKALTSTSRIIREYEFSRRQKYFEDYCKNVDIEQELEND